MKSLRCCLDLFLYVFPDKVPFVLRNLFEFYLKILFLSIKLPLFYTLPFEVYLDEIPIFKPDYFAIFVLIHSIKELAALHHILIQSVLFSWSINEISKAIFDNLVI